MTRLLLLVLVFVVMGYGAWLIVRVRPKPGESRTYPPEPVTFTCSHRTVEPVLLNTGEAVAQVCVLCQRKLPANWGCPKCDDWAEIHSADGRLVLKFAETPCDEHTALN